MMTLSRLRQVLPAAWGPDTCDPTDLPDWRPDNPSRGQCGVTALLAHDLLGGDLLLGDAYDGGVQRGVHYWNRLPDGTEIDLTRDQFGPAETVTAGVVAPRSAGPLRRCRGQYELLRHRVHAPASDADPGEPPTRIALVLLTDPTGAVLLQLRDPDARAEPGQWSLPGGHVEQGEDPGSAARRELAEETGLTVHSGLEPVWHAVRPDLTGATGSVEVHVYTGRTEAGSSDDLVIGEGQDARFVPAAGITAVDLSPTAAAVLHGTAYFRSCHMT